MKPRTAIFLCVVLLAFVAVILVRHTDTFKGTWRDDQTEAQTRKVWKDGPLKNVKQLTIEPAEGQNIRFVKDGNDWRIVEPIEDRAWSYMLDDIIRPLEDLQYISDSAQGDPDAPGVALTGLDHPKWTVTLKDEDDQVRVLKVGKTVPLSGGKTTYVQSPGDQRTYIVELNFSAALSVPIQNFRNRIVIQIDKERIDRILIEGPQTTELIKRDGKWKIIAPISAASDQAGVDDLLRKLSRFKIRKFLDDNPKTLRPYGLEPGNERLVVRFWTQAQSSNVSPSVPPKSYGIALGNKKYTEGERYAKLLDSPRVFLVRVSTIEDLQPSLFALRDKEIIPIETEDVIRVELDLPGDKVELINKDGQWFMTKPYQGKANPKTVSTLLMSIKNLKAESFRDDTDQLIGFGLDPARASITIHQLAKSDKRTLLIGKPSPSGEMTFTKRGTSNSIAVVKSTNITPLLSDASRYWDTTIFKLPAETKVTEMTVKRPGSELVLNNKDGTWSITTPLESGTDSDNIDKLIELLKNLRATNIVALGKSSPDKYVHASRRITFTVKTVSELPSPTDQTATAPTTVPVKEPVVSTHVLHAARIGRNTYAWSDQPAPISVGQFKADLFDGLSVELRDRNVWKIEPRDIQGIRIEAGDTILELRRDGPWKYTADPYVRIVDRYVKYFFDDIKDLQAEKFATYVPPTDSEMKKFALDDPWLTLTLTDTDGVKKQITVSHKGPDSTQTRYALANSIQGVLVISSDIAAKMARKLEDFKE